MRRYEEWRVAKYVLVRKGNATARVLEGGIGHAWAPNQNSAGAYCPAPAAADECPTPVRFWQYTDGAWEGGNGEDEAGGPPPPADYGVVEMEAVSAESAAAAMAADEQVQPS